MQGGAQPHVEPGEGILTQDNLELPFSNQMLKFRENCAQNLTISGTHMSVEMILNTGSIILSGSHNTIKIGRNLGNIQNRGMRNLVEIGSQELGGTYIDYGIDSGIAIIGRPQPVPRPIVVFNHPHHFDLDHLLNWANRRAPPGFEQLGAETALDVQRALEADAEEYRRIERRALERHQNGQGQAIGMDHREGPRHFGERPQHESHDHHQQNRAQMRSGVDAGFQDDVQNRPAPVPGTIEMHNQPHPCVKKIDQQPQLTPDDGRPKGPDYFQAPKWHSHYKKESGKRLERGIMTFNREIVEFEKLEFVQVQKELSKRYYVGTNQEEKLIVPHCRVCGEYSGRSDKGRLDCYVDCDKLHTYHLNCLEPWILHSAKCPACKQSVNTIKTFKAKDLPAGGTDGKKQSNPPL